MFNGIRFALGAVSLVPLILVRRAARRQKNAQPASGLRILFTGGTISGLCLFLGSSFQQMGIVYTTAGNAGFVTGLYVVFVPFIGRFFGHRSSRGRMLAILFSTAGLYLLSVNEQFRIHPGDALVVVSAVFWALHMLSIAWFARRTDPLVLSFLQFSVCSLLSLGLGLFTETWSAAAVVNAGIPILYGGIMSVGVAYTLQTVAQRTAHPAHAAIILSLEGAFAALGGWLILGETMSPRGMAGCALMFAGVLCAQWDVIGKAVFFRFPEEHQG